MEDEINRIDKQKAIFDINDKILRALEYKDYKKLEFLSRRAIEEYPEIYELYTYWFLALLELDQTSEKDAKETAFELLSREDLPHEATVMSEIYIKKFSLKN